MGGTFLGFILEILVAALLVATIVYCLIVNQKLDKLRKDQGHLREIIKDLNQSTQNAEGAIVELRGTVDKANKDLADKIDQADKLTEQLGKQNETSENLVTKLTTIGRALQKKMQEQKAETDQREAQMKEAQNRMMLTHIPALPMNFPPPVLDARTLDARTLETRAFDARTGAYVPSAQAAGYQPQSAPYYHGMTQPQYQAQAMQNQAMQNQVMQMQAAAHMQSQQAAMQMMPPQFPPQMSPQQQGSGQPAPQQMMGQPQSAQPQAGQPQMTVFPPELASSSQAAIQGTMKADDGQAQKNGLLPQLRLSALSSQKVQDVAPEPVRAKR